MFGLFLFFFFFFFFQPPNIVAIYTIKFLARWPTRATEKIKKDICQLVLPNCQMHFFFHFGPTYYYFFLKKKKLLRLLKFSLTNSIFWYYYLSKSNKKRNFFFSYLSIRILTTAFFLFVQNTMMAIPI